MGGEILSHRVNKTKAYGHKNNYIDIKAKSINGDKNEKMTEILNKHKISK